MDIVHIYKRNMLIEQFTTRDSEVQQIKQIMKAITEIKYGNCPKRNNEED